MYRKRIFFVYCLKNVCISVCSKSGSGRVIHVNYKRRRVPDYNNNINAPNNNIRYVYFHPVQFSFYRENREQTILY